MQQRQDHARAGNDECRFSALAYLPMHAVVRAHVFGGVDGSRHHRQLSPDIQVWIYRCSRLESAYRQYACPDVSNPAHACSITLRNDAALCIRVLAYWVPASPQRPEASR